MELNHFNKYFYKRIENSFFKKFFFCNKMHLDKLSTRVRNTKYHKDQNKKIMEDHIKEVNNFINNKNIKIIQEALKHIIDRDPKLGIEKIDKIKNELRQIFTNKNIFDRTKNKVNKIQKRKIQISLQRGRNFNKISKDALKKAINEYSSQTENLENLEKSDLEAELKDKYTKYIKTIPFGIYVYKGGYDVEPEKLLPDTIEVPDDLLEKVEETYKRICKGNDYFSDSFDAIFVSQDDNSNIGGFALIDIKKYLSNNFYIYVKYLCSHKRQGKKLLDKIKEFANNKKYIGINLISSETATEFYKKQGFITLNGEDFFHVIESSPFDYFQKFLFVCENHIDKISAIQRLTLSDKIISQYFINENNMYFQKYFPSKLFFIRKIESKFLYVIDEQELISEKIKNLSNPCLNQIYNVILKDYKLYIFMEYLSDHWIQLSKYDKVEKETCEKIANCIINLLDEEIGFYHNNICPVNIYLNQESKEIKVVDFTFSNFDYVSNSFPINKDYYCSYFTDNRKRNLFATFITCVEKLQPDFNRFKKILNVENDLLYRYLLLEKQIDSMFYKETMEQIQTETMEQMQTETMEQMQTETMEQMQTETMEQMQTETKEQIKKRKQYLSLFVNLFNKSNLPDVLNMILNELLQKLPRDDNVFTLENKIVYKN
jgi:hypothetical protein